MGRTAGVKNGQGNGYPRPQINKAVGAKESFKLLHEQKFLDEDNQLTAKAEKYVRARLEELGLYNIILLENFFLKGNVDYGELEK